MPQTHPEGGVSQETSIEERAEAYASRVLETPGDEVEDTPKAQTEATEAPKPSEQPEGPATDELTPDDLEVEVKPGEQPAVDAFEIVHNGTQVKLTREEAITYARQGFDYTQKTQAVAEKERFLTAKLQQLGEIEQVAPQLLQDLAQVKALEAQLNQYQNVNWVQVATDDPMGYAPARARYDELVNAYRTAVGQYQHNGHTVKTQREAVQKDLLQKEFARLPEFVPEWKDEGKRAAGQQEIVKYLQNHGIAPEHTGAYLNTAFALATAYKAAKYDQLVKAKSEKVKQLRTAPPVTVPGAKTSSTQVDKDIQLRGDLKKRGDRDTAAAVLLNRMK